MIDILRKSKWNEEDYVELLTFILSEEDTKYRDFHQKLVPTVHNLIGIRVPVLRGWAKEIAKGDYASFLQMVQHHYYEENMLHGLVINQIKCNKKSGDIKEILEYVKKFVPYIDNWAVCDVFCGGMKCFNDYKSVVLEFLTPYLKSESEFDLRFAVIILMNFFLDDTYIDTVFYLCNSIKSEYYYVNMGIAWLLSVSFVKYEEKTWKYLDKNNLDDFTYNKTLQKIMESNRVSKEKKAVIRKLKR